jgi:hypothetical protein
MNTRRLVATLAAAGLATSALGQEDYLTGIPVGIQDHSVGSYSARAAGLPVDNWTNANTTGLFVFLAEATGKHILDDFLFAPGPWSAQAVRTIDAVDFSLWSNMGVDFQARMRIWDINDVNFQGFATPGGDMINPGGIPIRDWFTFPTTWNYLGEGFVQTNVPIPGGPISIPGTVTGIAVEIQTLDSSGTPGASAPGATFFANNSGRGSASNAVGFYVNPVAPGFSSESYGRDTDNDGIFLGDPTPDTAGEHRRININEGGPNPFFTFAYAFAIRGDITVATPPACESLAIGADNVWVSDTETLANNGVKWYCVTLPSDATDTNYKYIDFQTQGSTDVAICVFDNNGILVAQDDEGGGSPNAQLSFGMGRRMAEGGRDFDGINYDAFDRAQLTPSGTPGLAAGTYYIAVACAEGTAIFGDGFFVSGSGTGGTTTLRMRTNVTGGAIAPSVPPAFTRITGIASEDPIVAPGGQTADVALYSPDTQWYDVQLCRDADAGNPVSFSVISPPATEPPGKALYIFDSNGNLVGSAQGGRPSMPTVSFGGSDPFLPAGTYSIATTFNYTGNDVDLAPNAASNGRWHVRPRVNDGGYTLRIQVLVPWPDCPGPACDPDVNCDGSADGFDVEVMEQAVGGDLSNFCQADTDFNGDGSVDGFDVEAVEQVIGGSPCP